MSELKDYLKESIKIAAQFYVNDLAALTHEQLKQSPGGKARTGYDFTHEVIVVNQRIAMQLRGEDPGPWPFGDDWVTCPEEHCDKEKAIEQIKASSDEIIAAIDPIPAEKFGEKFMRGERETSFSSMAGMAGSHMMYHGAQLNYLQAMAGDDEVHWS